MYRVTKRTSDLTLTSSRTNRSWKEVIELRMMGLSNPFDLMAVMKLDGYSTTFRQFAWLSFLKLLRNLDNILWLRSRFVLGLCNLIRVCIVCTNTEISRLVSRLDCKFKENLQIHTYSEQHDD